MPQRKKVKGKANTATPTDAVHKAEGVNSEQPPQSDVNPGVGNSTNGEWKVAILGV